MGSWFGWVLVAAGVYLVAVVVRGIIQLTSWLIEEFWPDSWAQEPGARLPPQHPQTASAASGPRQLGGDWGGYARWILVSAARVALIHWLVALAEFVRMLVSRRKYDYWVGSALAEDDPPKKVKYLSKALALNPGYIPGWGLKANALLNLKRYDEALACCEKILAANPNPLAWYEKGLCCYHLGRCEEAVICFDKTLALCSDPASPLRDDAMRQKKLAEGQMQRKGTA